MVDKDGNKAIVLQSEYLGPTNRLIVYNPSQDRNNPHKGGIELESGYRNNRVTVYEKQVQEREWLGIAGEEYAIELESLFGYNVFRLQDRKDPNQSAFWLRSSRYDNESARRIREGGKIVDW